MSIADPSLFSGLSGATQYLLADPVAAIVQAMSEEQCREEEFEAAQSQAERARLDTCLQMISELMGVTVEEAAKRVVDRMAET